MPFPSPKRNLPFPMTQLATGSPGWICQLHRIYLTLAELDLNLNTCVVASPHLFTKLYAKSTNTREVYFRLKYCQTVPFPRSNWQNLQWSGFCTKLNWKLWYFYLGKQICEMNSNIARKKQRKLFWKKYGMLSVPFFIVELLFSIIVWIAMRPTKC